MGGISMQQYILLLLFSTAQVANAVSNCMSEDKATGLCTCCLTGYSGTNCSICTACVQNHSNNTCRKQCEGQTMHGEYCNKTCPSTCSEGKCSRENGYCIRCKDGYYGELCSKSCDCLGGPCKRKTGTCIQWDYCQHCETKRCYKDGKDGTRVCHGKCEGPYYGIDCGKHCNSCNRCDQVTGSCLPDLRTSTDVVTSIVEAVVATSLAVIALIKLKKVKWIQHCLAWMWRKCRYFKPDDNDSPNKDTAFKRSVPPLQEGEEGERTSFLEADHQPSDVSLREKSLNPPKVMVQENDLYRLHKKEEEGERRSFLKADHHQPSMSVFEINQ